MRRSNLDQIQIFDINNNWKRSFFLDIQIQFSNQENHLFKLSDVVMYKVSDPVECRYVL